MKSVQHLVSPIVHLRVGESTYDLSSKMLQREPESKLASLARADGGDIFGRDAEGRSFIDRDGPAFRHVANFLRTGRPTPGLSPDARATLRRDAAFYELPKLYEAVSLPVASISKDVEKRYLAALLQANTDPRECWRLFELALQDDPNFAYFEEMPQGFRADNDVLGDAVTNLCFGAAKVQWAEREPDQCESLAREQAEEAVQCLREAAQALHGWLEVHAYLARAFLALDAPPRDLPGQRSSEFSGTSQGVGRLASLDEESDHGSDDCPEPMRPPAQVDCGSDSSSDDGSMAGPVQRPATPFRKRRKERDAALAIYALKHAELARRFDPDNAGNVALRDRCLKAALATSTPSPHDLVQRLQAYGAQQTETNLAALLDAAVEVEQPKPIIDTPDATLGWDLWNYTITRDGKLVACDAASAGAPASNFDADSGRDIDGPDRAYFSSDSED